MIHGKMKMENKEKNEITIANDINKRLQVRRSETVFPLSPTHRKELRELKNKNLGGLTTRLRFIRSEKLDEFKLLNKKNLDLKLDKHILKCNELNKKYYDVQKEFIEKEDLVYRELQEFSKSFKEKYGQEIIRDKYYRYRLDNDNEIQLKISDNTKVNMIELIFKEKYGKLFDDVREKIEVLTEQYEEAINFGDLEMVKEIYYIMKSSDDIFIKIRNIKL